MLRSTLCSILLAAGAPAADFVLESPATRTHLIELFTSEGCSSCPPADDWVRSLRRERGLWREFVPVTFHVNYWDHLGWPDRLASPRFTQRQRDYAALWNARTVYTPGFVLDGREWRGRSVPRPFAESAGVLRLRVAGPECEVTWERAAASAEKFVAHLVWLGGAVEHDVKAGENQGRKLRHDFTALSLESVPVEGGAATFRGARPAGARAIAAWITSTHRAEPLQVTGGDLPRD